MILPTFLDQQGNKDEIVDWVTMELIQTIGLFQ